MMTRGGGITVFVLNIHSVNPFALGKVGLEKTVCQRCFKQSGAVGNAGGKVVNIGGTVPPNEGSCRR
jgi:hypothetical protein